MGYRRQDRQISFRFEDDRIVRTVEHPDGNSYDHRCPLEALEIVAHVLDETPRDGKGATMPEIVQAENLPYTQVDVALAFLQDRGIIERRRRRNYAASGSVHLDAMVEWHAMREEVKAR